jgi:hypothetical protein
VQMSIIIDPFLICLASGIDTGVVRVLYLEFHTIDRWVGEEENHQLKVLETRRRKCILEMSTGIRVGHNEDI